MRLADTFLAAAREPTRAALGAQRDALEAALEGLVASARAAWPRLNVDAAAWAAWLAAHAADGVTVDELARLPAADLWLAHACAQGDAEAIRQLEAAHQPVFARAARRAERLGTAPDDFWQQLRAELFVAAPARPPRILDYRGRGPLGAFLRVVAARVAVELLERSLPRAPAGDEVLEAAVAPEDVEWNTMRGELRGPFEEALREASRALPREQRAVLRQYYVHGVGVDGVARLLGVHRSNASRALARARAELLSLVRRGLTRRLSLVGPELDEVIRLVRSQLTLSLGALLQSDPQPAES